MAPRRRRSGQTGQLWPDHSRLPGPGRALMATQADHHRQPSWRTPSPRWTWQEDRSRSGRCGNAPGVSTGAAAEWLRVNRSVQEVSPGPGRRLTRVLDPRCSAAGALARDEQAEATAAERDALVQAEAEVARLRRDLPSAETAREQQAVRVAVSRVGTDARTVANIAELTAR